MDKASILHTLTKGAQRSLYFTDGYRGVSLYVISGWIEDHALKGLIKPDRRGLYHLTDKGWAEVNKAPAPATARHCALSAPPGSYVPPQWQVRAGADQHQQYLSKGLG